MELRELEPEPFGSKIRRARVAADLTLDQAHERIARLFPASRRSVARLEELPAVPEDKDKRQPLAYYALLAFGVDPDTAGMADTQAAQVVDKGLALERLARFTGAGKALGVVHLLRHWVHVRLISVSVV